MWYSMPADFSSCRSATILPRDHKRMIGAYRYILLANRASRATLIVSDDSSCGNFGEGCVLLGTGS